MKLSEASQAIAKQLTTAGYSGLFLSGDHNKSALIWNSGKNQVHLEHIVRDTQAADLARLLASEVLYAFAPGYPPESWTSTLAQVYARALAITGIDTSGEFHLSGELWGFMYHWDGQDVKDYGALGTHLVSTGSRAIPYLAKLLDNRDRIIYEGSQEATLGSSLGYRVKDAAAYYIGQIAQIQVKFYPQTAERDAEIERLKANLQQRK